MRQYIDTRDNKNYKLDYEIVYNLDHCLQNNTDDVIYDW